ncbi:MAG: magnesium transporter [Sedimentisphaerales bacterium]|nr:magnesium transporter [Sedimentisphaerales bacterium]
MVKPEKELRDRHDLLDQIEHLIEAEDMDALRTLLTSSRNSDVAEVMEVLDEVARQVLFDVLDPEEAGDILDRVNEATRSAVVEDLSSEELTGILATLPPDEAADVIGELSEEQSEEVLDSIQRAGLDEVAKLLLYEEDTAGGIMTTQMVAVKETDTVADAITQIRESNPKDEFYVVFVVDDKGILKGTLGIHELLRQGPNTVVSKVMEADPFQVKVDADQEEIANLFRKNDLLVVGVVNTDGVLVGRITVDDVVDVMEEEAEEDALVMAGTHPAELETRGLFRAARVRLPWLLTCMVGSMFSGVVLISLFQSNFQPAQWFSIFMFFPAIVAMGGNSGLQTSTIVVRGLATGDLVRISFGQVFMRESRIALIVACVCGLMAGLVSGISLHFWPPMNFSIAEAPVLGLSIASAMFLGIMLSTTLGFILPFLFRRIGIDPAVSSGPLVTTMNDALGCLVYLSLSWFLLRLFT